jgi:hypothetical protein
MQPYGRLKLALKAVLVYLIATSAYLAVLHLFKGVVESVEFEVFETLGAFAILGIAGAYLAHKKNRNPWGWGIAVAVFSVLGFLLLAAQGNVPLTKDESVVEPDPPDQKVEEDMYADSGSGM